MYSEIYAQVAADSIDTVRALLYWDLCLWHLHHDSNPCARPGQFTPSLMLYLQLVAAGSA